MSEVDGKKNNIIENNKTFQVGYKPSKNPPSSVSSYKNLAKFELHDIEIVILHIILTIDIENSVKMTQLNHQKI